MTYREKYFELQKLNNKYLTNNVIKTVLMDDGGFNDFFQLLGSFDKPLKNEDGLNAKVEKIMTGEPYQYVLGYAYFVNSNYLVSPDVLIPRQETEQLAVSTMTMIVKMFGKMVKKLENGKGVKKLLLLLMIQLFLDLIHLIVIL